MLKKLTVVLIFSLILSGFIGCATAPYVKPLPVPGVPGFYHRVETGQTIWRISKMYNVDLDELVSINHISDASAIEVGQLIFIPSQRKEPVSVRANDTSDDFIWPLKGKVVANFDQTVNNMINKGINISPYSDFDVIASRAGRVVFYNDNFGGYGKTIIIDHGDGFSTVYTRNLEVFIRPGDNVRKGSVIAKAGSAGRDKNTYLHFEIRKKYIPQNPYFYLP